MGIFIGVVLALMVASLARCSGLDRERSFYAVVVIVVASYYDLFAVMSGAPGALLAELVPFLLFLAAALWGFRKSPWIIAAALVGHGIFDVFHARLIFNPGMPAWWPAFCASYDVTAGLYLAWRLGAQRVKRPASFREPALPVLDIAF